MRISNLTIIFYIFILIYFGLFLINPQLGPIDDHALLDTIQIGKRLDFHIIPEIGRFFPLNAQEYNIVAFLFYPTPFYYYLFNAIQFLILMVVFFKILKNISLNNSISIGMLIYLAFLPGFTATFFRLQVPERDVLFYLVLFIYFYLLHLKKEGFISLLLGLLFANAALYYKEPVFIMIGVFAFLHLLFSWKDTTKIQKLFDSLLLTSSAVFVLTYYFVVYRHIGPHRYGETPYESILILIKNTLNFGLYDPLIQFVLPILLLNRLYMIFIKKEKFDAVFDSLLAGSFTYFVVFLILNIMYEPYYLLPLYAFSLPSILIFYVHYQGFLKNRFSKKFVIGLVTFFLLNSVPRGIHTLSFNKYNTINFNLALDRLIEVIKSNNTNKKVNIFLDGVNRASGIEIYHSLGKFLNYKGLPNTKFDLKSDLPIDNPLLSKEDKNSPYSVFQSFDVHMIESGDYLIITPYATKNITEAYLKELKKEYNLVYNTTSPYYIPDLDIKTLVKFIIIRISNMHKYNFPFSRIISKNIFRKADYYIFKKK